MSEPISDLSVQLDDKLCSTLINSIRGIVWECDARTFRFTYVSPQAERILGHPCRRWIDEPDFWLDHIHPDDAGWCSAFCREATEKGEDHEFEYRMMAADGRIVWFHDIVTVSTDREGSGRLRGIMIDITEAKDAEMKLRISEERFRLAMQGANDGIWDWDLLTGVVYFSPRWKSMLGYADDELGNHFETWARLVHPDDRETTLGLVRAYIEGRADRFETEMRMRHKNGGYLNVLSRAFLSRDGQGKALRLVGTHLDITALKRKEEELHLIKHCVERAPMGICRFTLDGTVISANRHACESLGYSADELHGRKMYEFDPTFSAEKWSDLLRRMRESGAVTFETVHQDIKGARFPMEITASWLEYGGNEFLFSFEKDISRRKAMEQALVESEELHRRLVELSPDGVFIHTGGKFVFMNPAAARLLGGDRPEELYGLTALDFVHPDYRDMVRKRIENAWARGENPPVEELLVRPDGSSVPVEMVSVHFQYRGADSVLAIARDISERKRMQDEIVKGQKLESLGVLAGGIAHDFNNILTGILGNISLIRDQVDPSSAFAGRLESCENAAIRASELTLQLLTFARGGEPVKKIVDPAPLIRESATFVLRGSNVGFEMDAGDELGCIDADPGQISQVLHNLLINAKQAMPSGGVITVSASNEVLGHGNAVRLPEGNYIGIVVQDRGCGIPHENLPKIFDPYFTTKSDGSGLGLASVYSIVRRHGGAIEVTSELGKGSRFTIHLPAAIGRQPREGAAGREETPVGSGRILVMDDEEIIREVATEILVFAGYSVESCQEGMEAVERYRSSLRNGTPYDAVIMDLTVPGGMGGREAARLILEIDPDAVVIVSSGYSNDPVVADFHGYGFSGAVVKPFSAGALAAEVRRLIRLQE